MVRVDGRSRATFCRHFVARDYSEKQNWQRINPLLYPYFFRRLLCYWAVRETGISLRALARRLRISTPGVGYAVERGEAIVQESHYDLIQ